jgi:hypothetical protein
VKHLRLYGFITVLGIVLLTISFTVYHWSVSLGVFITYSVGYLFAFLFFSGTVFLTAGIWGIGKHYSKNNGSLFALYAIQLVVVCIFFLYMFMSISVPIGL